MELTKFTKSVKELKDIKDKWIYFVKNAGNMKMIPKKMQKPKELREAFEAARQMKWSKEELEAYDARGIYIQDERGRIEYALEEGEKVGYDKKAIEMAKIMKNEGEPIEKMSRYTNLSKEKIELL